MFHWTTKHGEVLKLSEIGNNHLKNIKLMLEKIKKKGYIVEYVGDIWGNDADCDCDEIPWSDAQEKTLKIIKKEIKKRKGGGNFD